MKKKSIQKLTLNKASISTLNANSLTGGFFTNSENVCESRELCNTRDYTRCVNRYNCGLFQYTEAGC